MHAHPESAYAKTVAYAGHRRDPIEKQMTEAFEKRQFVEVKRLQKELAEKRQRLFARLDALDLLRRMKTGEADEGDVETVASESQYSGF